jgi:uncharacterized protein YndB with AHSA1/START domain
MNEPSAAPVRVTRHVDAPPARVFDAWLDREMIGRWMFGPALRDEEVLRISLDPRVGGAFSFLVRGQGAEIDHVGNYLEIDRPRRLAFTWGVAGQSQDESWVGIDLVPQGAGAQLVLTHHMHPKWADFAVRVEESWSKMLDALASALATGKS